MEPGGGFKMSGALVSWLVSVVVAVVVVSISVGDVVDSEALANVVSYEVGVTLDDKSEVVL